jgi:hypothetical protein
MILFAITGIAQSVIDDIRLNIHEIRAGQVPMTEDPGQAKTAEAQTSLAEERFNRYTYHESDVDNYKKEKKIRRKPLKKEIKTSLMNRYRESFIAKLTPQDLDELQNYLRKQYDKDSGWNSEYKLKFEAKLRQYFHEEFIRREIASIETLLGLIDHKDLNTSAK